MEFLVTPSFLIEGRALFLGGLHLFAATAVTVHTLINKRDVPAAIGWIGMAWLAPVFGALLYVAFGINRVKRRARRLMKVGRNILPAETGDRSSSDAIERLKIAVGKITGQAIEVGEVAAILQCGDEAYPQMLGAIEGAKLSVDLSTYIFRTDELGQQFIEALVKTHRKGVRTRILIDGFGGGFLRSPAYRQLRKQGVPVARFLHSTLPWKMPLLDLRLHKKTLIVDSESAFVGGLNIGADNLVNSRSKAPIRDIHFCVKGTVVRQIEQDFEEDWSFATGEIQVETGSSEARAPEGGDPARAIVSGPDQEVDQLVLVLLSAVNAARHSIKIATPYFLPDEQLLTALKLAALRGVDVHLMLPAVNNHRLVAWAFSAHVRPLLETGCHLWRGPPPFDHSKLVTIDGRWCLIGSANWDTRSLRLNFELTVELYNPNIARRLALMVDERSIEPITLQEIDNRLFVVKLRDAAARLLTPYL